MDIILATSNPSKALQIQALLSNMHHTVKTMRDVGIVEEIVEDGTTLAENALIKARFVHSKTGQCSIADDSGIYIDALGGKPGIYSARWAGEGLSTEDIMSHTLATLAEVPIEKRSAQFKAVAAIVLPDGSEYCFEGKVDGTVLAKPRTQCQPQMPYSAIFECADTGKTWAEMTTEEENAISHRGKAFRQLRSLLESMRF